MEHIKAIRTAYRACALALLVTAAAIGHADTLALYTCEDGVSGQPVETLVNKRDPSLYSGTAYRMEVSQGSQAGNMPMYTNTVPGNCIYSDSMCTQIVARTPMAILFSSENSDVKSGGCIDLDNLARALRNTGKKSFTIELFWRSSAARERGYVASLNDFWWRAAMGSGTQPNETAFLGVNTSQSVSLGSGRVLHTQGWRHWAMTYDGETKTGRLYYDYEQQGTLANEIERTSAAWTGCPSLRLGAEVATVAGDHYGARCASGEMTCIRVSDEALAPDDFLRMGVAAFYPFKDGDAGAEVSTVTNSLVAGDATGTAGCLNKMPTFSDDRPGRYIYSSMDKGALLCENPGSVSFATDNSTQPQGHIAFAGLAGRLLTSCREASEVTYECFFKKEHLSSDDLALFSLRPNSNEKTNMWSVCVHDSQVVSKQDWLNTVAIDNEGESFLGDGRWHHLAVVWGAIDDKNWKSVSVYLDYALATNSVLAGGVCFIDGSVHWYSQDDRPFVLGHVANFASGKNGFMGKVSSMRITTKALTPERFMVASDTTSGIPADYGFRWRFEEGVAGADVVNVSDAASEEKWTVGELTKYGSGVLVPTYSTAKAGRIVVAEGTNVENNISIAVAANAAGKCVVLENKTWCGFPTLHPKSWTMEFCAKSSGARSEKVLLAGRGRLNPKTGEEWRDWAIELQPNGKLALSGFRSDGDGGATPYSFADLGRGFDDGVWHRVVATYNGDTREYGLWLDEDKILEETLPSVQVDSTKGRYQFGQGCGASAFEGHLDEIRFVGRVLSPAEFAKVKFPGLALFVR